MSFADERDDVAAKIRGKPLWYRMIMREHYRTKWDREAEETAATAPQLYASARGSSAPTKGEPST